MSEKKELVNQELKVINMGVDAFLENLEEQGVEVVHVDWHPPAGGDKRMIDILDKLDSL